VSSLGVQVLEIPEVVVGALGLRNLRVRLSLASVDNVREFYGVLDKENGNIISDEIPVSLLGVEFGRESAHITDSIGASTASKDGGKSNKNWSCTGCIGENFGMGNIFEALIKLEGPERA